MKVKRRELLLASLVTTVQAQEKPEELIDQLRRSIQGNKNALEKVKLPMATEPAFVFQA